MGCDLFAAVAETGRRLWARRADKQQRSSPAAAAAKCHAVAVAFHHPDAVKRDAQKIGEDLRICRGVAHAEIERACNDRDRAIRLEMDRAEFLAGRRGDFQVTPDTETAQQSALFAFALALFESGVIGCIKRLF